MAVYHFVDSGNNANAGTAALPKKNFDGFSYTAGDVLLVDGQIRSVSSPGGTVLAFTSKDNITLAQWARSGCKPAQLCLDILIAAAGFAPDGVSTNVQKATITTGLTLQSNNVSASAMIGAGQRIDDFGRHCPFLFNIYQGVVTTTVSTVNLTGVGTKFTKSFAPGDSITVAGEGARTIATIPSDTSLTVTVAFSATPRNSVNYSQGSLANAILQMNTRPWTWYYDSATGTFCANLNGEAPSNTNLYNRISYTLPSQNAAIIQTSNNFRRIGVSARWANDPSPGFGYGIQITDCASSLHRDCKDIGVGYHPGVGGTTSSTNNQTGHRLVDCDFHGCGKGGSSMVFYAANGTVSDCKSIGCRAYPYGRIMPDGVPFTTADGAVSYYCHTGDSTLPNDGPWVTDVEYIDCVTYGYPDLGPSVGGWDCANSFPPSDPLNHDTYAVRRKNCRTYGGVQTTVTDSISSQWCFDDYSYTSAARASWAGGTNAGLGGFRFTRATNLGSAYVLFDGCAISCRLDQEPGSSGESFFTFSSNVALYDHKLGLKNCTYFENGEQTNSSVRALFKGQGTSARTFITCIQSILGFSSAESGGQVNRLITNDVPVPDVNLVFTDNAYFNFHATNGTRFSAVNAGNQSLPTTHARDTRTLWTSIIDPGLVIPAAYPLLGASHYMDTELTTAFKAITKNVTGHALFGYSVSSAVLHAYSLQYGMAQYGNTAIVADPANVTPAGGGTGGGFPDGGGLALGI